MLRLSERAQKLSAHGRGAQDKPRALQSGHRRRAGKLNEDAGSRVRSATPTLGSTGLGSSGLFVQRGRWVSVVNSALLSRRSLAVVQSGYPATLT